MLGPYGFDIRAASTDVVDRKRKRAVGLRSVQEQRFAATLLHYEFFAPLECIASFTFGGSSAYDGRGLSTGP